MKYVSFIKLDLGESVPSVKEVLQIVNKSFEECGSTEKVLFEGRLEFGTITVDRELTQKEIHIMENLFEEQFKKRKILNDYKFSVELKPCKSQKSCYKSKSR